MSDAEDAEVEVITEVELVELDSLIPYANNPKNHPPEQVGKIASSIKNYGFDQPIVIDGDGEIIKGHGRYAASQKLGLETVPVVWRDGLTPPQVKGARIADNKSQMESGFDYDILATEVQEIDAEVDDLDVGELIGFERPDVEDLLERDGGAIDDLFEGGEEFVPEAEKPSSEGDGDGEGAAEGADAGEAGEEGAGVGDESSGEWDGDGEYDGPVVPAGEFECPHCGESFEPSVDDMGE